MSQAPTDVIQLLGKDEQVMLYIRQKIYHPTVTVDSVLLTNERIILRHPHSLGIKKDYTDYAYNNIANVILDKGLLRSTVRCIPKFGGNPLNLNDLPNADAEKAYGIIRENLMRYQTTPSAPASPGTSPNTAAPVSTQEAAEVTCKYCNTPMDQGQNQCPSCGATQ